MSHPEAPILPVDVAQAEYQGLINCSPNDPRDVRKHALAESDYLDIDKMMPVERSGGSGYGTRSPLVR
jgi:hypothetical protein